MDEVVEARELTLAEALHIVLLEGGKRANRGVEAKLYGTFHQHLHDTVCLHVRVCDVGFVLKLDIAIEHPCSPFSRPQEKIYPKTRGDGTRLTDVEHVRRNIASDNMMKIAGGPDTTMSDLAYSIENDGRDDCCHSTSRLEALAASSRAAGPMAQRVAHSFSLSYLPT